MLAVGADEGYFDIFLLVYHFSFLSPSLGEGPIETKILYHRAIKPKTINQPNHRFRNSRFYHRPCKSVALRSMKNRASTMDLLN